MELDPVLLSRFQFAWLIAWHILMPAFTVGMASYIAILEGMHLFTKKEVYFRISTFWIRIFSVAFGVLSAAFSAAFAIFVGGVSSLGLSSLDFLAALF